MAGKKTIFSPAKIIFCPSPVAKHRKLGAKPIFGELYFVIRRSFSRSNELSAFDRRNDRIKIRGPIAAASHAINENLRLLAEDAIEYFVPMQRFTFAKNFHARSLQCAGMYNMF